MTDFRDDFDDDLNDDLDDDFTAFRDDLFGDEQEAPTLEDLPPMDDIEDEFDQLRQKSVRGESLDDDLDSDDAFFSEEESSGGSGFAWSSFSPSQRLILALLVLLNIIMGTVGLLVVTGRLG